MTMTCGATGSVLQRNYPETYVDVVGNNTVGPLANPDFDFTAFEHQLAVEDADRSL